MSRTVAWLDLGFVEYLPALELQKALHEDRRHDRVPDTLIIQETPPVITLGRSSSENHILIPRSELEALGFTIVDVARGGDVSYHGPGQLVVSPVLRLRDWVTSVHEYLRMLEEVVLRVLANYGLKGTRVPDASGVWVGNAKIAAVGIVISHGVTQHGIALNVHPDLEHFGLIRPCGLENTNVTSLLAERVLTEDAKGFGRPQNSDHGINLHAAFLRARDHFITEFSQVFPSSSVRSTYSLKED